MENPAVFTLLVINLLISSGALWKLIEFSAKYGALTQEVKTHGDALKRVGIL